MKKIHIEFSDERLITPSDFKETRIGNTDTHHRV